MAFDLSQFFAPITTRGAQMVGSGASGAVSQAHGGVTSDHLDYSTPAPHDDPDTWDTVWLAEIPLPPVGTGFAKIKTPWKVKVDKKTKTGAPKPRLTTTGGEAIECTITVKFISEALPAMESAVATLVPGSGPYPVRHPKAKWAHLEGIVIEGWNDAPEPDAYGVFTWELHGIQVDMPAQNGAGGGIVSAGAIAAQIQALEKRQAAILAEMTKDNAKQNDPKLVAELQSINVKRGALEQQLNEKVRPAGAVNTPKQQAATAKPGDAVKGDGTVAGQQHPADEARSRAQSDAAEGAEP